MHLLLCNCRCCPRRRRRHARSLHGRPVGDLAGGARADRQGRRRVRMARRRRERRAQSRLPRVPVTFLAYVGVADADAEVSPPGYARRGRGRDPVRAAEGCLPSSSCASRRALSATGLDFEDGFADADHAALLAAFTAALADHDLAVPPRLRRGTLEAVAAMIAAVGAPPSRPVVVDPKALRLAAGATAITQRPEFAVVAGRAVDEVDFAARGFRLRESLALEYLPAARREAA